jgi:hypothetical protein
MATKKRLSVPRATASKEAAPKRVRIKSGVAPKPASARPRADDGPELQSGPDRFRSHSAPTPAIAQAQVRIPGGASVQVEVDGALAMRWSSAVHNRRRWSDARGMEQAQRAADLFPDLTRELLPILRGMLHPHLEVSTRFTSEDAGWQARIFPWEYVLSAIVRAHNLPGKLTVTRQLEQDTAARVSRSGTVLYVESAPCGLRTTYDFSHEYSLMQRVFADRLGEERSYRVEVLRDPTRAVLRSAVEELAPEVIHLTGFDSKGAIAELSALSVAPEALAAFNGYEGMLLDQEGLPDFVSAEPLARLLTASAHKPRLVSFNLHHSAARMASLAVAHGVANAVAFLDEFEDDVTERFFGNFYPALGESPLLAFAEALDVLRRTPEKLRGTAVVLWSREPAHEDLGEVLRQSAADKSKLMADDVDLFENVRLDIEPVRNLNYALLHNHRDLFQRFEVHKEAPGTLRSLEVEVALETGGPLAGYRATVDLTEHTTSLKEQVRIPLTAPLARAARESVRTALYVSVSARGHTLYRKTHGVTLLPVDEWRDNKQDGLWLPSFVLPRDPAVAELVRTAQRYLMAISDDPSASFDGYQSVDLTAKDPYAQVHAQVRALWSTLLYEAQLSYVNPPPSYTTASQRLRTPSDIMTTRHGTCIDLCLLVAALLEYVDIFPVIILLQGHAFPAYWRSDADFSAFVLGGDIPPDALAQADGVTQRREAAVQRVGWSVDATRYHEVLHYVQSGQLIPLETVWLTQRKSFAEALEAGYTNLRSKAQFDSLIDIRQAREHGVTPLPIRGE